MPQVLVAEDEQVEHDEHGGATSSSLLNEAGALKQCPSAQLGKVRSTFGGRDDELGVDHDPRGAMPLRRRPRKIHVGCLQRVLQLPPD